MVMKVIIIIMMIVVNDNDNDNDDSNDEMMIMMILRITCYSPQIMHGMVRERFDLSLLLLYCIISSSSQLIKSKLNSSFFNLKVSYVNLRKVKPTSIISTTTSHMWSLEIIFVWIIWAFYLSNENPAKSMKSLEIVTLFTVFSYLNAFFWFTT